MEVLAMTDQEKSREALGLAFEHIKALHLTLAALMIDVAALRHVVLKGSKKSKLYRRTLACGLVKAKPLIAVAMQAYQREIADISVPPDSWKN
jgi:hypothetical protein